MTPPRALIGCETSGVFRRAFDWRVCPKCKCRPCQCSRSFAGMALAAAEYIARGWGDAEEMAWRKTQGFRVVPCMAEWEE